MLNKLEDALNKTCMIGLSYFDSQEQLLKQTMLGGKVIKADNENGITLLLISQPSSSSLSTSQSSSSQLSTSISSKKSSVKSSQQNAHFIIPADLSCWFVAPKGDFHTSETNIKISDPDYLITWDIFQTKADKSDGEQQWWQWRPRIQSPQIK